MAAVDNTFVRRVCEFSGSTQKDGALESNTLAGTTAGGRISLQSRGRGQEEEGDPLLLTAGNYKRQQVRRDHGDQGKIAVADCPFKSSAKPIRFIGSDVANYKRKADPLDRKEGEERKVAKWQEAEEHCIKGKGGGEFIPQNRTKLVEEEEGDPFIPCAESQKKNQEAAEKKQQEVEKQELFLPNDLVVDNVLPLLPLPKIYQLRCVSQMWNSQLRSTWFLQQSIAAQQQHQPWLVMARKSPGPNLFARDFIMYVPSLSGWFTFPLHLFPHISIMLGRDSHLLQFFIGVSGGIYSPANLRITSAGGLICCMVYNVSPTSFKRQGCQYLPTVCFLFPNQEYTFLVFNPLTGHMKTLPPYPCDIDSLGVRLSMYYDQADNSYKVVVSRCSTWSKTAEAQVYDSKTGSWKVLKPDVITGYDINNADLFFYTCQDYYSSRYTLYGYHMKSDTWSSIMLPAPRIVGWGYTPFFLQKLRGDVILAHGFGRNLVRAMSVWKLCIKNGSSDACWVRLSTTPKSCPREPVELCDAPLHGGRDISYATDGRHICMTAVDFVDDDYRGHYSAPLLYDLEYGSWSRLSSHKGHSGFMGLFYFQPTSNVP